MPSGTTELLAVPDGNEPLAIGRCWAASRHEAALRGEHCDEVSRFGERALARGGTVDDESADGLS